MNKSGLIMAYLVIGLMYSCQNNNTEDSSSYPVPDTLSNLTLSVDSIFNYGDNNELLSVITSCYEKGKTVSHYVLKWSDKEKALRANEWFLQIKEIAYNEAGERKYLIGESQDRTVTDSIERTSISKRRYYYNENWLPVMEIDTATYVNSGKIRFIHKTEFVYHKDRLHEKTEYAWDTISKRYEKVSLEKHTYETGEFFNSEKITVFKADSGSKTFGMKYVHWKQTDQNNNETTFVNTVPDSDSLTQVYKRHSVYDDNNEEIFKIIWSGYPGYGPKEKTVFDRYGGKEFETLYSYNKDNESFEPTLKKEMETIYWDSLTKHGQIINSIHYTWNHETDTFIQDTRIANFITLATDSLLTIQTIEYRYDSEENRWDDGRKKRIRVYTRLKADTAGGANQAVSKLPNTGKRNT